MGTEQWWGACSPWPFEEARAASRMILLAHLHPSPMQGVPGEGEAALLPQAMRSEFVLHAPGCCPRWVMWQRGPTWERKRNPLGYECTCLRRPHAGPLVWQQSSSSVGFPGGSAGKESTCNAGDMSSIPGSGRSPGRGYGNPLQRSCLGSPMDREAWWATVHGVAKSQTWLSDTYFFILVCGTLMGRRVSPDR